MGKMQGFTFHPDESIFLATERPPRALYTQQKLDTFELSLFPRFASLYPPGGPSIPGPSCGLA